MVLVVFEPVSPVGIIDFRCASNHLIVSVHRVPHMQGVGCADDLLYFKCPTTKQMRCPVNAYQIFTMPPTPAPYQIASLFSTRRTAGKGIGEPNRRAAPCFGIDNAMTIPYKMNPLHVR